jgi:hypothetical protein
MFLRGIDVRYCVQGGKMQSISPVYTEELVQFEQVIALDQPEYLPLITLSVPEYGNACLARYEFSKEERELIADGADIVVAEMLFGSNYTPMALEIVPKNTKPTMIDIGIRYKEGDNNE